MSPTRGQSLAADLEMANDEVVRFALSLRPGQWQATVPGEGWSVGVVVHHVAAGYALATGWLRSVSRGEAVTDDAAGVDEANALHALEFAAVGVDEAVELLRTNGAAAVSFMQALDDGQLARTAAFGPGGGIAVSAEQVAGVLARHCRTHLSSVRDALGPEGASS